MKPNKKLLITLNIVLIPIIGVLSNVLAANFPVLPPAILWGGGGTILGIFIIISIVISLIEEKSDSGKITLQQTQKSKQEGSAARPKTSQKKLTNKKDLQKVNTTSPSISVSTSSSPTLGQGRPTIEAPLLLCMAIDVSRSMKKPILDHTGKTIRRWASVQDALEEFVYLGAALVTDPGAQRALPVYYLMAYGFGFREVMHSAGVRKTPGGAVRDLLAHPSLSALPSAAELSENWAEYKEHLLSMKEYTGDLFGLTPLCQALQTICKRIKEERKQRNFTDPILLLIISDGLADDGNPLPYITELHSLGVITLSCYLADQDVLASKQLYMSENPSWTDGAKLLFHCASPLHKDNYVSQAMFDYFDSQGWHPEEGVHLFAQVNQTEMLGNFLEVLLKACMTERSA